MLFFALNYTTSTWKNILCLLKNWLKVFNGNYCNQLCSFPGSSIICLYLNQKITQPFNDEKVVHFSSKLIYFRINGDNLFVG